MWLNALAKAAPMVAKAAENIPKAFSRGRMVQTAVPHVMGTVGGLGAGAISDAITSSEPTPEKIAEIQGQIDAYAMSIAQRDGLGVEEARAQAEEEIGSSLRSSAKGDPSILMNALAFLAGTAAGYGTSGGIARGAAKMVAGKAPGADRFLSQAATAKQRGAALQTRAADRSGYAAAHPRPGMAPAQTPAKAPAQELISGGTEALEKGPLLQHEGMAAAAPAAEAPMAQHPGQQSLFDIDGILGAKSPPPPFQPLPSAQFPRHLEPVARELGSAPSLGKIPNHYKPARGDIPLPQPPPRPRGSVHQFEPDSRYLDPEPLPSAPSLGKATGQAPAVEAAAPEGARDLDALIAQEQARITEDPAAAAAMLNSMKAARSKTVAGTMKPAPAAKPPAQAAAWSADDLAEIRAKDFGELRADPRFAKLKPREYQKIRDAKAAGDGEDLHAAIARLRGLGAA